ncbi:MAG: hypothetical protein R2741_12890 [Methanolobus sp.]
MLWINWSDAFLMARNVVRDAVADPAARVRRKITAFTGYAER